MIDLRAVNNYKNNGDMLGLANYLSRYHLEIDLIKNVLHLLLRIYVLMVEWNKVFLRELMIIKTSYEIFISME